MSEKIRKLPSAYAHGSASVYRWRNGPDRLAHDLIETVVCEAQNQRIYEGDAWATGMPGAMVKTLIERCFRTLKVPLPYDDLLHGVSLRQLARMRFKARLADGTSLGAASLGPNTVRRLFAGCCQTRPERRQVLEVPIRLAALHEAESHDHITHARGPRGRVESEPMNGLLRHRISDDTISLNTSWVAGRQRSVAAENRAAIQSVKTWG